MLGDITVKVCGLTREQDVDQAIELGADLFGFILYAPSPRGQSLQRAMELAQRVPQGRRVAVDVSPTPERLSEYKAAGFDFFQIHAEAEVAEAQLDEWASVVGSSQLWLAPRLKPEQSLPESFLSYADTILLDTYSSQQVGGTGRTGDWASFAALRKAHSEKQWVLAGGLNPENILAAIEATGANHLDVNSGVESAPGVKDSRKLEELFRVLRSGGAKL